METDMVAATAADVVYKAEKHEVSTIVRPDVCGKPMLLQAIYNKSHLQCGIFRWGDIVIVAFRGTHSGDDWMKTNLRTGRRPFLTHECFVHEGFHEAYWFDDYDADEDGLLTCKHKLHQQILRGVQSFATPEVSKLIFTGHSMGGALATLCLAVFLKEHPNLRPRLQSSDLVTFGSPRVGCTEFAAMLVKEADDLGISIRRYVTQSTDGTTDLVSRVPLGHQSITLQRVFKHVSDAILLPTNEKGTTSVHRLTTYTASLEQHLAIDEGIKSESASLSASVTSSSSRDSSSSHKYEYIYPWMSLLEVYMLEGGNADALDVFSP